METASAALAGAVHKIKGMSGIKKGLELAKVAQEYAQQQGVPMTALAGNAAQGQGHAGLASLVQGVGLGSSGFKPGAAGGTAASAAGFGGLTALAGELLGHDVNNAGGAGLRGQGFQHGEGFQHGQGFQQGQGQGFQQGQGQGFQQGQGQGFQQGQGQGFQQGQGQGFQQGQGFPGAGGQGQISGQPSHQPTLQRSHSFNGTGNYGGFGQQQGGGFNTATGYASAPGTPRGFSGQAAPGYLGQPTSAGQQQSGFYQPGYGQGFSGSMATQGQPAYASQTQSWPAWGQQSQPVGGAMYNGGYGASPVTTAGQYGSQSARGSGWPAAGMAAAAGLAGAGLATAYNQGYGGTTGYGGNTGYGTNSSSYGYGLMPGYQNNSTPYGGPMTLPTMNVSNPGKGGKGGGKGNKGNKGNKGGGGGGPPVTEQPQGVAPVDGWLHVPPTYELPEGIPKGLEILAMVDGLMVHQEVETLEAIANAIGIGYEGNNQYKISNRAGVHVYQAVEDTGFFWRCCCTQLRPVHMKVFDQTGNQVLAFQRHFRCFPCAWFEPCRENVTVYHGSKDDNKVIGRVTQSCCGGCCTPKLNILSRKGDRELMVKGPCVIGDCCGVRFDVLTDNKKKVGEVKKLPPQSLADIAKEIATDADKFTISFPQDLKVETKATALVALLVVDLLFFEYGGNTNRNLDGTCTIDLCVMFCCGCPIPCRVTVNSVLGNEFGGKGAPAADQIER